MDCQCNFHQKAQKKLVTQGTQNEHMKIFGVK